MTHPFFFGYGSLVNRATHTYPNADRARAHGWRRAWVHTPDRPFAYLSAVRDPSCQIDGLIAEVPNADWSALDVREAAYERIEDSDNIHHNLAHKPEIAIYSVPEHTYANAPDVHPILLSYLDVVLQGYLTEFGPKGAVHFVSTTDGWDAPILNDRHKPYYPRHQTLTDAETDAVDGILKNLGAMLITDDASPR